MVTRSTGVTVQVAIRRSAVCATLLAGLISGPAVAQSSRPASSFDAAGYYVSIDLGWGLAGKADMSSDAFTGKLNDLGSSAVMGGSVGYRLNSNFRFDVSSTLHPWYKLQDTDETGNSWGADVSTWATLVNAYAEYPMGSWSPYVMAGAGVARNHVDSMSSTPGGTTIGGKTTTDFAWQVGAGVGLDVSPNWTLDFGYRYLDAGKIEATGTTATGTEITAPSGSLRSNIALLSMRYNFGGPQQAAATAPRPIAPAPVQPAAVSPPPAAAAPPPPPPAMAAAAPTATALPVTYMVFFDWNRADISAESDRVLREASDVALRNPITRVVATGHADRSGSENFNLALSIRRASAVKATLVRNGVPENLIVILGRGEREPLVPTADGVREARNRRVEIVVQ